MSDLRDIATLCKEIGYLTAQVDTLRKERDEARQWVCQILANPKFVTGLDFPGDGTKYAFAEEQGWDCFKNGEL